MAQTSQFRPGKAKRRTSKLRVSRSRRAPSALSHGRLGYAKNGGLDMEDEARTFGG